MMVVVMVVIPAAVVAMMVMVVVIPTLHQLANDRSELREFDRSLGSCLVHGAQRRQRVRDGAQQLGVALSLQHGFGRRRNRRCLTRCRHNQGADCAE